MSESLPSRSSENNAEARIQAAVVEWVRSAAPELVIWRLPNGGLRSKAEAARLKGIGTLAGVPDLVTLGRYGQEWLLEATGARWFVVARAARRPRALHSPANSERGRALNR